tara:strand:- start:2064 stop:3098 length:1035 start_codon:yes stop_codon:yes gene_type:complete
MVIEGFSSDDVLSGKEFWKDKIVFITGATGFLGSWTAKILSDYGAKVVCLVRDGVPESNFYKLKLDKNVTVVNGDFNDFDLVDRTINEYEVDTVFHIGAQTIVSIANRNPVPTLKSNILGTINVLEACRNNKTVKRIVIASSDKAYGTSEKLPYDETTPLRGEHPYDVSKSCVDLISNMYYKTYGLPVCVTRCGNLYGPGDLNFNRIVPGIIRDIYNKREPVIRSDGTLVRSYFFVKDAVHAYIRLAEKMDDEKIRGESFNFSTDDKTSVLELVNMLISAAGSDLKPRILNEVKNEIAAQYLSSEKAKNLLQWSPKYRIEDCLKETVDWYMNFLSEQDGRILQR